MRFFYAIRRGFLSVVVLLMLGFSSGDGFFFNAEAATNDLKTVETILKKVTVPAELKKALVGKKTFNEDSLKKVLTYKKGLPNLKLKSGKIVALEPVSEEPAISSSNLKNTPTKLAQKLQRFNEYISKFRYGPPEIHEVPKAKSNRKYQTDIRDQGGRRTCVAFATVAAIEAIYKREGVVKDLSENYAYNKFMSASGSTCMDDPGYYSWKAAGNLTNNHICEESQSLYINSTTSECSIIPIECSNNLNHGFILTKVFDSSSANNTNYLEALIDSDYDIVIGLYCAGSGWYDGTVESGTIDVQTDSSGDPSEAFGAHAMLIVGYNQTSNYFICKNSWGNGSGHDGYIHLSYEYLQTYAINGYVVILATEP